MDKHSIRAYIKAQRSQLDVAQKQEWDESITKQLQNLALQQQWTCVYTYWPLEGEVDTLSFIKWATDRGIQIGLPQIVGGRQMHFQLLSHIEQVRADKFKTMVPINGTTITWPHAPILVPGLAFDKKCFRLGFGGGYYDTFLAKEPLHFKIGLAYPFQVLPTLPTESHDCKMDMVLTPKM
jgi:5-formyltetrahydrofolate cyclo-ligase